MSLWKLSNETPSIEEVIRHKVLFVIKFLHEAQHEATAQFFNLPRVVSALEKHVGSAAGSVAGMKRKAAKSVEKGAGATGDGGERGAIEDGEAAVLGPSPARSTRSKTSSANKSTARPTNVTPPSSQVEALQVTPEGLGNIARGDSGHALEERILGGRLKHRHLHKKGLFQEQSSHSYSSCGIC